MTVAREPHRTETYIPSARLAESVAALQSWSPAEGVDVLATLVRDLLTLDPGLDVELAVGLARLQGWGVIADDDGFTLAVDARGDSLTLTTDGSFRVVRRARSPSP